MSRIRANTITNQNANGAPNFPNGITVTGVVTTTTITQNITGDLTVSGNVGIGGTLTYEDVTNIDSVGVITARSCIQIGVGGTIGSSGGGIVTYFGDGSQLSGVDATSLKDGSSNVIVQASSLDVVVSAGKTFKPATTNSTDLGTTNERWRNLFVNDAHFSNEGSSNSVDGTWGDWTLQEGENKIFMINNRTGKKYSLKMEEE